VVGAAKAGESWPLWGTCLGHELLLTLAAGADPNLLTSPFDSENISWPLFPTPVARNASRLWGGAPPDVWEYLTTEDVTMNSHQAGVSPNDFAGNPTLMSTMKVLSVGYDRGGKPFVSSAEGLSLPLFSTQFHPEKPLFEWWSTQNVNHSAHSVVGNSYLQRFFVDQARMNSRQFPTPEAEAAALIYNYDATYVGATSDPSFQQVYFFA
jgi:gamma-glutamyl hydrolase